jgi:hypothetical protein
MKACVIGCFVMHSFAAWGATGGIICDFELLDQYARPRPCRFPKTRFTIIAISDGKGAGQLAPWIREIYSRYQGRVDIEGIADVSSSPKILRPLLKELFKKQVSYPVMLDWSGSVVRQFAYQKEVANIYLVDPAGRVAERLTGEASEKRLQLLFTKIDEALLHN